MFLKRYYQIITVCFMVSTSIGIFGFLVTNEFYKVTMIVLTWFVGLSGICTLIYLLYYAVRYLYRALLFVD